MNNRKVLNGVLEVAGLSGDDKAAERGIVLRAIDKLDRLGPDGVRALLGQGRKDESGDFTEGAGLDHGAIAMILAFAQPDKPRSGFAIENRDDSIADLSLREIVQDSAEGKEGLEELDEIIRLVRAQGYDESRIKVYTSVVRGLEIGRAHV